MNITEEQMDSYIGMYNWAKGEGCSEEEADALGSLISYANGNRNIKTSILARWRELGIINDDGVVVLDKDCIAGNGVAWALLAMTFSGLLERLIGEDGIARYRHTAAGEMQAVQIAHENSPMFEALDLIKKLSDSMREISDETDKEKLKRLDLEIEKLQGKILLHIGGAGALDEKGALAEYENIKREIGRLTDKYLGRMK